MSVDEGASNPAEDSLEDLENKLSEYDGSLQEINDALKLSPNDPGLIRLSHDLKELVTLYEDLVRIKRGTSNDFAHSSASSSSSSINAISSSGFESVQDPQINALQTLVGRTCYALYEDQPYIAEVVEILPDPVHGLHKLTVEYIGWGNRASHPIKAVHLFHAPAPEVCTPGSQGYAVYSEDGLWYPCCILERLREGFRVQFRQPVSEAVVKPDRFRLTAPSACVAPPPTTKSETVKKKIGKEIVTPGGYKIPESLKFNPQDPEKVKLAKKKKISLLKKEQRKENVEHEARDRQSAWLKHTARATKKTKTTAVKGRLHQSIFKTSDAPENKVGVTGSGQKMTQFGGRMRHVYEEEDED